MYYFGFVLKVCFEILDYVFGGIVNWCDLMVIVVQVRGYFGVLLLVYEDVCYVMGQEMVVIVIVCIL